MNNYSRAHPFFASIKDRYALCKIGSKKNTQHIVLDIKDSGIKYNIGDSVGIAPLNDPILIDQITKVLHATGQEIVTEKQSGHPWQLHEFLAKKANIVIVTKKLMHEIWQRQTNPEKKQKLADLHAEENKELLKAFVEHSHLWDVLTDNQEVAFTPQELCHYLLPLLPRFYSIASSQNLVGDEIHLTVAFIEYELHGHRRRGVCTHYLCHLVPLEANIVPLYIQPTSGFTIPEKPDASIIMIGPGTGVAPFRAFMQERKWQKATGKNWLFFGEWNRETDFFYESFWKELADAGMLRYEVAFSRDQDHKIYVQQRMLEKGAELFSWLQEGAYLYVCGDAKRMAKDVEAALLKIIEQHGHMSEGLAKDYLKALRSEKRYLRDVY